MSEREKRNAMIAEEMDWIIKGTKEFVWEHLEEDFEEEAIEALHKAASELAYRKKYYDVCRDEIIYFPSVSRLILRADLTEEAERHYYDEQDEWPLEYTKALKTVVRKESAAQKDAAATDDEGGEDEEYMEKLATYVDL